MKQHKAITPATETRPATIQIDPEFQARIVPLTPDERKQLEENLQRDGCRDPLVVWRQVNLHDGRRRNLLLDGHHRFEICERRKLRYTTTALSFTTRAAALEWIDMNQLGRRNLTAEQVSLVRGRVYNRQKKTPAQSGARGGSSSGQNAHRSEKTAERLAKQHGVNESTIRRDGDFADAVESLKPVVPDIEAQVMTGKVRSKAAVLEAAREPDCADEILEKQAAPTRSKPPHVTHNSKDTNEWFTPAEYIEAARTVLGAIDLDPASCAEANDVVKADRIFTVKDNGLSHAWSGRVWMNPPYGTGLIEKFAEKLVQHVKAGDITAAIVLVNNATDTVWFHALTECAHLICFPKGRIKFRTPGGREPGMPVQGQALFYFNTRIAIAGALKEFASNYQMTKRFLQAFAPLGFVVSLEREAKPAARIAIGGSQRSASPARARSRGMLEPGPGRVRRS